MGCMSASDAAPLPRLGEVFFDVRGSSRSMRLSWYADTGVAVFSIWQGGMCTGTFRLAIGDLPRMIETLQRGPGGQPSGRDPAPTEAFGDVPMDAAAHVRGLDPLPGDELPEYQTELMGHGPGSPAGYQAEQRDYGPGAPEYLTDRPDHLTGSSPYPTRASDYPAEAAGHRARPGEYPAEPPGQWPGSGDYLAGPADHPADASYPGRRSDSAYAGAPSDASYPGGRPDASYLGQRSEAPYPGRPDASYPGAVPRAPYPGRSDPFYPGASTGGPHSRGTDGPGGPADDPYLGGTGPTDYPAEPSPAHYPPPPAGLPFAPSSSPFTSPPGHDAGAGRSGADYPAHYGPGDSDDITQSPPPESFPYGSPPRNRGPGPRHADPDAPVN